MFTMNAFRTYEEMLEFLNFGGQNIKREDIIAIKKEPGWIRLIYYVEA